MNANQLTKIPVEKLSDTLQFLIVENEIPLSDALKKVIGDVDAVCKKLLRDEPAPAQPVIPEVDILGWIHEDKLPENYPYDAMFKHSKVDVVRMFPVFSPCLAQKGWVVSNDQNPKIGDSVLVYMQAPIHSETNYAVSGFDKYGFNRSCVTHWMPLPAAPAQESE